MNVPALYEKRSECRGHIKKEMQARLRNSNFFISPRVDFDLVRYSHEASCNTYLRYRVIEETKCSQDAKDVHTFPFQRKR